MVKIINANGNEMGLSYDADGNATGMTDGNGYETAYEYDALGRISKQTNPDSTSRSLYL